MTLQDMGAKDKKSGKAGKRRCCDYAVNGGMILAGLAGRAVSAIYANAEKI
jgi:hypothetical protein